MDEARELFEQGNNQQVFDQLLTTNDENDFEHRVRQRFKMFNLLGVVF